jgi:hypothetical protein
VTGIRNRAVEAIMREVMLGNSFGMGVPAQGRVPSFLSVPIR